VVEKERKKGKKFLKGGEPTTLGNSEQTAKKKNNREHTRKAHGNFKRQTIKSGGRILRL